ncbi:MAG: hypothetical protein AAF065_09420 [Verrucomicrobiota bacterium]
MELHEKIESIDSKDQLVDFLSALKSDFSQNKEDWENPNLERYLDAMEAWTGSWENLYKNTGREFPEQPTWSMVAEMLYAAKIYE